MLLGISIYLFDGLSSNAGEAGVGVGDRGECRVPLGGVVGELGDAGFEFGRGERAARTIESALEVFASSNGEGSFGTGFGSRGIISSYSAMAGLASTEGLVINAVARLVSIPARMGIGMTVLGGDADNRLGSYIEARESLRTRVDAGGVDAMLNDRGRLPADSTDVDLFNRAINCVGVIARGIFAIGTVSPSSLPLMFSS